MIGLQGDTSSKPQEGSSKPGNAIVIAAAFIAAVKLARSDASLNSPKVHVAIEESITIAHRIYIRVQQMFPRLF